MSILTIPGMTCQNCLARAREQLHEHKKLADAGATPSARKTLSMAEIKEWLQSQGEYLVMEKAPADNASLSEKSAAHHRLLLVLPAYLPLMIAEGSMAACRLDPLKAMRRLMGGFLIALSSMASNAQHDETRAEPRCTPSHISHDFD